MVGVWSLRILNVHGPAIRDYNESFLLVFRISHIVTAVHNTVLQQGRIAHADDE